MRVLVIDISGRVEMYDKYLSKSLLKMSKAERFSLSYKYPGNGLIQLVPKKFQQSYHLLKRIVKIIEGLLNYSYIGFLLLVTKVDALHLQWLPFLEFTSIENYILKLYHLFSPKTKFVLTIHNIYPHDSDFHTKQKYKYRFERITKHIHHYIVHTEISRGEVCQEFGLHLNEISVSCHGVFTPKYTLKCDLKKQSDKLRLIQFGLHSFYKGTDLLVEAVNMLPPECKKKIEVYIVGAMSDCFYKDLREGDIHNIINWKPYYLEEHVLYDEIDKSDIIILPYRAISQSGVLLLSIFFEKLIITSNLPSFKETLTGLGENCFFENDNASSLARVIQNYINRTMPKDSLLKRIKELKALYTWDNAAAQTLSVYNNINQQNNRRVPGGI